ncbi:MAG TPA: DUF3592 domain-containing protein [Pirellulales bacterium]|nr:DUF3592 domain-containing protein [Pirellulales bacterium]
MSRFFRLYEKKRGDRRTGSKAFGNFGEALFFGIFLAVGCTAFAFMFALLVWPEWRANRQFAETTCVVLEKQVGERPATENEPAMYLPEIRIRYKVEGGVKEETTYDVTRMYSADKQAVQAIVDRFEIGKEYPCWYDPINPDTAVLVRGYSGWLYLLLLIPLSFMAIGGGGLIYTILHWNASAERRALMAQRAAQLDLFEINEPDRSFPMVPADANLTNSPGTTLAYRLPIATTAGWTLFAVLAACLLWNAIVSIFVVMAARGFARGEPDWMLTVFIFPFAVIGLGLIGYLLRQVVITTGVGPTRIEISAHPLAPGQRYDLFLSQAGRLTIQSLEVWLACDEQASYRQGTDTRTESRRVYQERCFFREAIEIHQGLPFESRCQIQVPLGAMHSFHANHNEVNWKLIVKGNVAGRREYQRVFQIVVNPAVNGHAPS